MPKRAGHERDYVDKAKTLTKGQHRCKCKFCDHMWDGGANRMRAHILGLRGYGVSKCDKAPKEVKVVRKKLQTKGSHESGDATYVHVQSTEDSVVYGSMANQCENETHGIDEQNDEPKQKKREPTGALQKAWDSKVRVHVDIALHSFFFAEDIPFWKVRSPYFQDFVTFVGRAGPSYKAPSRCTCHCIDLLFEDIGWLP
ncbi:hypothetical protein KP509_1Z270500 [Ceratopteris richardii]|nr:hypothetical protein KP509_1Z304400 [Ceratopteris richardii]KAH6555250.1 hypothetical protein KP509_1Z270500 [Ceratopteris richardii]